MTHKSLLSLRNSEVIPVLWNDH